MTPHLVDSLVDLPEGPIPELPDDLPVLLGVHVDPDVLEALPLLVVVLPDVQHLLDAAQERHGCVRVRVASITIILAVSFALHPLWSTWNEICF